MLVSLPAFVPSLIPALVLAPLSASVSRSRSSTVLWSCYLSVLISFFGSLAVLLFCCLSARAESAAFSSPYHAFVSCHQISAHLSLLPSVLGPTLPLGSSTLQILKQSLSDEPWPHMLTNSANLFCSFLAFGI